MHTRENHNHLCVCLHWHGENKHFWIRSSTEEKVGSLCTCKHQELFYKAQQRPVRKTHINSYTGLCCAVFLLFNMSRMISGTSYSWHAHAAHFDIYVLSIFPPCWAGHEACPQRCIHVSCQTSAANWTEMLRSRSLYRTLSIMSSSGGSLLLFWAETKWSDLTQPAAST